MTVLNMHKNIKQIWQYKNITGSNKHVNLEQDYRDMTTSNRHHSITQTGHTVFDLKGNGAKSERSSQSTLSPI